MAKRTVWTFRPDATFVASRTLTLAGRDYLPGQVIDPTGLSGPRLRRLYETRWIQPQLTPTSRVADASEPDAALPESGTVAVPESPPFLESVSLPVRRRRIRSV